jgi:hypothetical protein
MRAVSRIKAIGAFLYDFVIGDDWLIAAGVAVALAVTYGISRTSAPTWWVMPAAVVVLLPLGLWRVLRQP